MLGGLWECFSPGQWSSISPDPLSLLGPASSPSVLLEKPKQLILHYKKNNTVSFLQQGGGGGFSEERMTEFFIFGETNQTLLFKNNNGS